MAVLDLEAYQHAIAPFYDQLEQLRPDGAEIIDVHTHLGLDEDGRSLDPASLLEQMDAADVRRACVFPLHDPERVPAYRVPNDRVLEWARESDGRLIPFCRLDPSDHPLEEAERALGAGARGIKLHPRAQSFMFEGDSVAAIFAFAADAGVPILIHAGRGLPPVADGLSELIARHPDLRVILAHAAIADLGIITDRLADHPGVFYDTSAMFTFDLLHLFARVPAERVAFGSDPPYGNPRGGLFAALRVCERLGIDDATRRCIVGAGFGGVLDGSGPPATTPPRGDEHVTVAAPLLRIYTYCAGAAPALFSGNRDWARGGLELALAACRDPRAGSAAPALEVIAPALATALELLQHEEGTRPALTLIFGALTYAATELV